MTTWFGKIKGIIEETIQFMRFAQVIELYNYNNLLQATNNEQLFLAEIRKYITYTKDNFDCDSDHVCDSDDANLLKLLRNYPQDHADFKGESLFIPLEINGFGYQLFFQIVLVGTHRIIKPAQRCGDDIRSLQDYINTSAGINTTDDRLQQLNSIINTYPMIYFMHDSDSQKRYLNLVMTSLDEFRHHLPDDNLESKVNLCYIAAVNIFIACLDFTSRREVNPSKTLEYITTVFNEGLRKISEIDKHYLDKLFKRYNIEHTFDASKTIEYNAVQFLLAAEKLTKKVELDHEIGNEGNEPRKLLKMNVQHLRNLFNNVTRYNSNLKKLMSPSSSRHANDSIYAPQEVQALVYAKPKVEIPRALWPLFEELNESFINKTITKNINVPVEQHIKKLREIQSALLIHKDYEEEVLKSLKLRNQMFKEGLLGAEKLLPVLKKKLQLYDIEMKRIHAERQMNLVDIDDRNPMNGFWPSLVKYVLRKIFVLPEPLKKYVV